MTRSTMAKDPKLSAVGENTNYLTIISLLKKESKKQATPRGFESTSNMDRVLLRCSKEGDHNAIFTDPSRQLKSCLHQLGSLTDTFRNAAHVPACAQHSSKTTAMKSGM